MMKVFVMFLSLLSCGMVYAEVAYTPAQYSRIVFLGSSTTDGHTYPALLQQAFAEAKLPVPLCINAGVGGDVAEKMVKRIDRDVLAYKPTLVILQGGSNDASHKVATEEYIKTTKTIIARLQKEKNSDSRLHHKYPRREINR